MQQDIIKEMVRMMQPVHATIEQVQDEISTMKLDVRFVRCEAEEATMQVGLAHGAAEEANNLMHILEKLVRASNAPWSHPDK